MPNDISTKKVKKQRNTGLIIKVSLFWILLAVTALSFVLYGQYNYNKGVFEGIAKTQSILQSK